MDHPTQTHDEGDGFLVQLREPPRPAFAAALYERLAQQEAPPARRFGLWERPFQHHFPLPSTVTGAVVALLLGAALTLPVGAATILRHSAPREIAAAAPNTAPILQPRGQVVRAPMPTQSRQEPMERLAHVLGRVPLVPTYLPPRCAARERFTVADFQVAYLTYTCVTLSEQVSAGRFEQPAVGASSTEAVTVAGRPALYVKGMWVDAKAAATMATPNAALTAPATPQRLPPGTAPPTLVWMPDVGQTLTLERDGLLVRLEGASTRILPKDELLRIAASLLPIR